MEEKPKTTEEKLELTAEKPKPTEGKLPPEEELNSKSEIKPSLSQTEAQSSPNNEESPDPNAAASAANRVGSLSSLLFFGSSLFAIGCMGWFAFLWWGTADNSVWHSIVINDWAVRAISLPSSAFRIAISVQASQCLSMLAALAIEKSIVPLPELAAISIMRATPPGVTQTMLDFVYPLMTNTPGIRDLGTLSIVSLTSLMVLTSSILGFTSTILLSDVVVQPIPSEAVDVLLTMDYSWKENGLGEVGAGVYEAQDFRYSPVQDNFYWRTAGPIIFPAFAEYSAEPPAVPGLVDTGTTIRAFVPFASADDRSRIRKCNGTMMVWDARVVCQKPQISNFRLHSNGNIPFAISGLVRRSVSSEIMQNPQPEAIRFFCGIGGSPIICQLPNSDIGNAGIHLEYYDFPPLSYGGGLKSVFGTPDRKTRNGGAYLILNSTFLLGLEGYLNENPEWAEVGVIPDSGGAEEFGTKIIGTLCYTPLDAVDREVEISRTQTKTEPEFATYQTLDILDPDSQGQNVPNGFYTFENTLPMLLPGDRKKKPESRGLFNLVPPQTGWAMEESAAENSLGPWPSRTNLTRPQQLPIILDALYLKYQKPYALEFENQGNYEIYGNFSVALDESFAELETAFATDSYIIAGRKWQNNLFAAVKDHPEGNVAFALQAVLTVIASNAYYAHLELFNRLELVSLVTFQNLSSPGGPYGTRRGGEYSLEQQGLFSNYVKGRFPVGYTIVAAVLGFQILLAAIILVRFLRETSITRIGDPWQALAQVASEEFEGIESILELSRRVDTNRDAVANELKTQGADGARVGIEQHDSSAKLTYRGRRNTELA